MLRDYQKKAIDSLNYDRDLIYLATGSGKSIIFKEIAKQAIRNDKKVCFIVYGKSIVEQASRKHFSEITDSVCMVMGVNKFKPSHDLYCCSISTIARSEDLSRKLISDCDLFMVDEAHNATSDQYKKLLEMIPKNKPVIGLTATPFWIGNRGHSFWKNVIHPTTTLNLIQNGHLVMPKVFVPEKAMSIDKVKKTAGDFNNNQLFVANNHYEIYQGILSIWEELGKGKSTLGFAINRTHAAVLTETFNRAGYPSAYADAETPQNERLKLIQALEKKEITCLFNVNIFSVGVDIPPIECGLMARPTSSLPLWIQQVGRMLRPYPGKKLATIIDCGANTIRLGHPLSDFEADLAERKPRGSSTSGGIAIKDCPNCGYITATNSKECLECGHIFNSKEKEKDFKGSNFVEYDKNKVIDEKQRDREWLLSKIKKNIDPEIKEQIEDTIEMVILNGWKRNSFYFKIDGLLKNAEHYIRFPAWYLDIKRTKN